MTLASIHAAALACHRLHGEAFVRAEAELYRAALRLIEAEGGYAGAVAAAALASRPRMPTAKLPGEGDVLRESDGKRRKMKVPAVEDRAT